MLFTAMREILFWSCLPWVFPQALAVRRKAPRFNAPPGATCGRLAGERPLRLLGIGDSVIAGVGASTVDRALVGQTAHALGAALDAGVAWECIGRIGATSSKVAQTLASQLPAAPADFIVVSAGVNDITSMATLAQWRQALSSILKTLRQHSPDAVIGVAGIPPLEQFPLLPRPLRSVLGLRGKSFDRVAREVIAPYANVVHVALQFPPGPDPFAADGFHPSESSYQALASVLATAMLERAARVALDV